MQITIKSYGVTLQKFKLLPSEFTLKYIKQYPPMIYAIPPPKTTSMTPTMKDIPHCFASACAFWPSSLTFLILVLSCPPISTLNSSNENIDRLALLSFKSLVSDPFRALASWNDESLHFCRWRGVTCRNQSHLPRVTALELESLDLASKISPSLANLTFLRRLHLADNRLHGPIPQELGLLSHLQRLNLSSNALRGMIPMSQLQNCLHLQNPES